MLQGIVERQVSKLNPNKNNIFIYFTNEEGNSITVIATDITAGGFQFWMPLENIFFNEGDRFKLHLDLPFFGKTTIEAQIKIVRFGIDLVQKRIVNVNAKLIDVTMEIWNAIMDYCRSATLIKTHKMTYYQERNDIRINAQTMSKLYLEDGHHFYCRLEDISFGGAKLRVRTQVTVNDTVKLLILNPLKPFELKGECIWSEKRGNQFLIGILFEKMNHEMYNQLRSYIYKFANWPENCCAS